MDNERLHVLLVEDDSADAALMHDALGSIHNYDIVLSHADRLSSALEALTERPVDVVLLDLQLPDSSGLSTLGRLRLNAPEAAIVVLTGVDDEGLAIRAVQNGAQEFIVKSDLEPAQLGRSLRYGLERQRLVTQLRDLDTLKSQFLSTASHEMRTPLAIIREFVSLVHDDVPDSEDEKRECLASALRNCDRLSSLLDDLLDMETVRAGKLALKRRRVAIASLLEECRHDLARSADGKNQRMTLELPGELPLVLCDADKIRQVLVNLIGNAIKFTPEGGSIHLSARRAGHEVQVAVTDSGPGIADRDAERIFEPFVQVDRKDGPGLKGTGLGLPISRRIVELHGGSLAVRSDSNRGSCFEFSVPVFDDGADLRAFIQDFQRIHEIADPPFYLFLIRATERDGGSPPRVDVLEELSRVAQRTLRRSRDQLLLTAGGERLAIAVEGDAEHATLALRRVIADLSCNVDLVDLEVGGTEVSSQLALETALDFASRFGPLQALDNRLQPQGGPA